MLLCQEGQYQGKWNQPASPSCLPFAKSHTSKPLNAPIISFEPHNPHHSKWYIPPQPIRTKRNSATPRMADVTHGMFGRRKGAPWHLQTIPWISRHLPMGMGSLHSQCCTVLGQIQDTKLPNYTWFHLFPKKINQNK